MKGEELTRVAEKLAQMMVDRTAEEALKELSDGAELMAAIGHAGLIVAISVAEWSGVDRVTAIRHVRDRLSSWVGNMEGSN